MFSTETKTGQQVEITEESISLDSSTIPASLITGADVRLSGNNDHSYHVIMHTTQGGALTIPYLTQQDAMIIAGKL